MRVFVPFFKSVCEILGGSMCLGEVHVDIRTKKRKKKKYTHKIKETPILMTKACRMNIYPTETQSSLTALMGYRGQPKCKGENEMRGKNSFF